MAVITFGPHGGLSPCCCVCRLPSETMICKMIGNCRLKKEGEELKERLWIPNLKFYLYHTLSRFKERGSHLQLAATAARGGSIDEQVQYNVLSGG